MDDLVNQIRKFRQEREWEPFHTPENLAKSISIEAAELLQHFQWDNTFDKKEVCEELADVMIYCVHMADALDVDLKDIMTKKMVQNAKKYPVEKARGNSKKYTEF
ncbi:MAG: nucleotide pyrophosphohydrolase [Cellulosilyticaceae bacterium]